MQERGHPRAPAGPHTHIRGGGYTHGHPSAHPSAPMRAHPSAHLRAPVRGDTAWAYISGTHTRHEARGDGDHSTISTGITKHQDNGITWGNVRYTLHVPYTHDPPMAMQAIENTQEHKKDQEKITKGVAHGISLWPYRVPDGDTPTTEEDMN